MDEKPVVVREGFTPVQGCLLAAVILFVLLLGISIVLAYRQFRENTAPSTPTAWADPAAAPVPGALAAFGSFLSDDVLPS